MEQASVQETYLQLWEALCQGHDGSREGRRLKLQVLDTILFRGGRPAAGSSPIRRFRPREAPI